MSPRATVALAALPALTACGGAQPGGLYALNCSEMATTNPLDPARDKVFGRLHGLVVVDETAGKIFLTSENIAGVRNLRDSCEDRSAACLLKFTAKGASARIDSASENSHFVYDRHALTFTLDVRPKRPRATPSRAYTTRWTCRKTEFPTKLWQARRPS